jgi:hypothetical protein
MYALGQKQTFRSATAMSALPPKADIRRRDWNVRFGPGVTSGFVGAKHIQLSFVNLATHSSIGMGSSLIA